MHSPAPLKLVDIQGEVGIVDTGEYKHPILLHFLESVSVNDYVYVYLRFAIQRIQHHVNHKRRHPTISNLRTEIEKTLVGDEYTVLLTTGEHAAGLRENNIRFMLPPNLSFIYGPGCAACLTPLGYYRNVFQLAQKKSVILVTFNEVMNMPTPEGTLFSLRMAGADVRAVHSPYDVLRIAEWNRDKEIVLAAVGFDLMAAFVGATIKEAQNSGITNLSVFHSFQKRDVLLREFLKSSSKPIDGVVCSTREMAVYGVEEYNRIARELGYSFICAGTSPLEVLSAVSELVVRSGSQKPQLQFANECKCLRHGNTRIRNILNEVYTVSDTRWVTNKRVEKSKYTFREEFLNFDAQNRFLIEPDDLITMPGCQGRDIQLGLKLPNECPMFATRCKPSSPIGPAMISYDGLCNTWYHSSLKK